MRIAAVLFLLLALTAGIFAAVDYGNNETQRRDSAATGLSALSIRADVSSELREIDRAKDMEREDLFLSMFAVAAIAASIALFSFAKHHKLTQDSLNKPYPNAERFGAKS